MATRFRSLFLIPLAVLLASPVWAQEADVIEPQPQRREITEANIDTENFEIGIVAGVISIEDFYEQATAGQTSFEILSGGAPLLTDDERNYRYFNLGLGYNLNGETFITDSFVINSAAFFTVGAGSTKFGGDQRFTLSLGAGYRVLLTDYFSLRVELKDHLFNSELIGQEKTTHNIQYGLGATFFF